MTRLVASLAAAAVLLTGCSGSGARSVLDPFSRTRVEPPRTGCIMGQPADPYYSGTRQAALPNPPATRSGAWTPSSGTTPASTTTPRPTTTPKAGYRYAPPGSTGNYRGASTQKEVSLLATGPGDRIAIPLAARNVAGSSSNGGGATAASDWAVDRVEVPTSPVAATSSAVATTDALGPRPDRASRQPAAKAPSEVLASRERIVRTVQPRPTPSAGASLGSDSGAVTSVRNEPGRLAVPQQTIDIMDLPPPGATNGVRSASRSGRGAIWLVSATAEVGGASATPPQSGTPRSTDSGDKPRDSFSPRAHYGYDPEYGWLRGRLEYSEIDRRWKLRYIPIDGATDEFGGSVVLSDASRLSGYERGQFVEVHGGLGRPPEDEDRGYAPEFQIHEIKRLGT
ncbi:MAG TPA: hypothetical protein VMY37_25385 [Thermoguttaceae bacterium]|nr:hypothetical protein [Thermoguttaceae bacterium]